MVVVDGHPLIVEIYLSLVVITHLRWSSVEGGHTLRIVCSSIRSQAIIARVHTFFSHYKDVNMHSSCFRLITGAPWSVRYLSVMHRITQRAVGPFRKLFGSNQYLFGVTNSSKFYGSLLRSVPCRPALRTSASLTISVALLCWCSRHRGSGFRRCGRWGCN